MRNHDYLRVGIAAIVLAVITPIYWILEFSYQGFDTQQWIASFDILSVLFLITGLLSIVVYLGLIRILHDHHNYSRVDYVLKTMVGFCVVFYSANFVLDVMSTWVNAETIATITVWLWLGSLIVFGVIDILLAILLLIDAKKLSKLLTGFAIVNLLVGIFELTVVFSLAVIVIYPIAMLLLAMSFLNKPEEIELV